MKLRPGARLGGHMCWYSGDTRLSSVLTTPSGRNGKE